MLGLILPPGGIPPKSSTALPPGQANVQVSLPPAGSPAAAAAGTSASLGAAGGVSTLGVLGGTGALLLLDLLFPRPAADADLDALMPPEPAKEAQPPIYPFRGGQSAAVLYAVSTTSTSTLDDGSTAVRTNTFRFLYGPIGGVRFKEGARSLEIFCRGAQPNLAAAQYWLHVGGGAASDKNKQTSITAITREDGLPDTGGDPPPIAPPILSAPGNQTRQPQAFQPGTNPVAPAPQPQVKPPIAPSVAPPSPGQQPEEKPKAPVQPHQNPVNPFAPAPQPQTPQQPQTPGGDPETNPPVAPAPSPSATPNAIPGTSGQPGILIGPAANPGTTQITFPSPGSAFGANPVPVQNFVGSPAGDPTPQPSPIAPPAPITPPSIQPAPEPTQTEKKEKSLEEKYREFLITSAGVTNLLNPIFRNTTPQALTPLIENAVCRTTQPGGCTSNAINNAAANVNANTNQRLGNLGDLLGLGADGLLMAKLNIMDNKLGSQITGGLSGGLGRMSRFLGIDRVLNLLNTLAILHNAMMLSASLKITLLEMLSSIGNATGLLQTSEGDNVDLNQVFNNGIEGLITHLIGAENYAGLRLSWRKYSAIYRAATNSLNAITSMFNSLGEAIETTAEYTGKIGNALRAAGAVSENAYNFFSEKVNARTSRFMRFQTRTTGVSEILEAVNEVAENVIEGQEQFKEYEENKKKFNDELAAAKKNPGIDNAEIKAEAEKIKENLAKDPSGEDDEGLLSFLTDN